MSHFLDHIYYYHYYKLELPTKVHVGNQLPFHLGRLLPPRSSAIPRGLATVS